MLKSPIEKEDWDFFKTIPKSIYPHSYYDLQERKVRYALKYFFSLLLLAHILMLVIAIPKIILLSSYLDTQFSKIEQLDIDLDIKTKQPILLTDKEPTVVINTNESISTGYKKLLITGDKIYFKESVLKTAEIDTNQYKNILGKKEVLKKVITILFFTLLPAILSLMYVYSAIKYLIIIFAVGLITYLLTWIFRYKITIRSAFISSIYASTIMIAIEVISIPYQIGKYLVTVPIYYGFSVALVPLAAYITVYVIAVIITSKKESERWVE